MELCSDFHAEVCYDSKRCPVCDLRSDTDDAMSEAREEIAELKKRIESLESEDD